MVSSKIKYKIEHLIAGLEKEAGMRVSAVITQAMHNEFKDVLQALAVY